LERLIGGEMKKVREHLHKEVFRVGHKHVDHYNLTAIEAVAMSLVAILSITVGTIYGSILS
jgi:hypothetical protein